jgi:hypothetical protein
LRALAVWLGYNLGNLVDIIDLNMRLNFSF